jgi:hypothetical protein
MVFSILLLLVIVFIAYKISPKEKKEHALVHGAGQIGLLAAIALFGVDYFTSFYYGTGEMMSALHPYGLQQYGYIAAGVIAFGNIVFGALYMYSLGVFNEGGGSYTASMRYLAPTLSLIVAVTLIQDYVLTIVVSALSGADQLLSVLNLYGTNWIWHFAIGAVLALTTWYLTIRGRGESARVVFTTLGIFIMLTLAMAVGLILASTRGIPPQPALESPHTASLAQALMHLLTASMKGMVALTGLEAMSNGIQFVIDEDFTLVRWGKKHLPRLKGLWHFYSGKSGIGRMVQTSFLFYGGVTTFFLAFFSVRFNVFDGTAGRTLVGNLAYIAFTQLPGGQILFYAYQILAVLLLAAASMTAFQDAQATEWRDVAIGEIPEVIVYRDPRGTFTRSVTITFGLAVIIMLLVRGQTTQAVPFYGVGVFMPIMVRPDPHLGRLRCRFCRRFVCSCVRYADHWQMERRRLGGFNLVQHSGPRCPPAPALAFRLPYPHPDRPDRAQESARRGPYGIYRGVAVAAHAGISLHASGLDIEILRAVWHPAPGAIRVAHYSGRV